MKRETSRAARRKRSNTVEHAAVGKAPTGIDGLDRVTEGGLPRGRPTLVCGGPGCGKTVLAMSFVVNGITRYDEPGVFVSFEESGEELAANVASQGIDLAALVAQKKLVVDHVRFDRGEIEETGDYDLGGLFVRLGHSIAQVGAKRVALDTPEALFTSFPNAAILRAEIRRLFRWLKDQGVTAVITGEPGDDTLTRQGFEEYLSDCVISLDHRVVDQVSTRRLRVVKYRGSPHGTNEYPFLIDQTGMTVLPITAIGLDYPVSTERTPTGVAALDEMLGGGYFRGSGVLISGQAGTGKSCVAAEFANAACARGERCVYFALEESPQQIARNMRSIGLDLRQWIASGQLQIHPSRPALYGLETHLVSMYKLLQDFAPACVVIDPISSFLSAGALHDVKAMLVRLLDYMRMHGITSVMTSLVPSPTMDESDVGISSLIDTWLQVRELEANGERNRVLYVVKSRGMPHSNQVREFLITSHGIDLVEVYTGAGGVVTGTARVSQEAAERADSLRRADELRRLEQVLEQRRRRTEAEIAALQAEYAAEEARALAEIEQARTREAQLARDRENMRARREHAQKNRSRPGAAKRAEAPASATGARPGAAARAPVVTHGRRTRGSRRERER